MQQYLLTKDSPRADQPLGINITLKPHQLASLHRMIQLDKNCELIWKDTRSQSNIGILADTAGYGKTLEMLALITELLDTRGKLFPHVKTFGAYSYGINTIKEVQLNYIDTSLIVVPDNLVKHWQRHLDLYTELNYEIIHKDLYNKIVIEDYDLLLCPAKHYNGFVHANRECSWNRVIFDEADSIYIPNTHKISTRFLWLVTATCENIVNRRNNGFIKDLFANRYYNIITEHFQPVTIKCQEQFIKESFSLVEPSVQFINCRTPHFINAIHNHVGPKILEYINAGDLDTAIIALGGNVDTDRNIIELVTRGIRNDIVTIHGKINTLDELEIPARQKAERRAHLQKRLESLETRKESLETSISDATNASCTICCDTLNHPTLTPCCNNMFCAECLLTWFKTAKKCPMCRATFHPSDLQTISKAPPKDKQRKKDEAKDKISAVIDIIQDNPDGKFIVFSGHAATFHEVGTALSRAHLPYGVLSTVNRTQKTLDKFRTGQLSIILLDARNNGAGIEIPEATDVILYHEMGNSLETQAIGRAQRPGRQSQLRIWKLRHRYEYADAH